MNEKSAKVIQITARTGRMNVKIAGTPTRLVTILERLG
jgi:hypothetical protein